MRVKAFHMKRRLLGSAAEFASEIERRVNEWLASHPDAKIDRILQSASGGSFDTTSVTVSIWYEEAQ